MSFNFIDYFIFPDFSVSDNNSIHCVQRACVILLPLNSLEIVLWSQICLGECSLFLYTWANAFSYCWLECYVDILSSWSVTLFSFSFPYDILFVFSITGSLGSPALLLTCLFLQFCFASCLQTSCCCMNWPFCLCKIFFFVSSNKFLSQCLDCLMWVCRYLWVLLACMSLIPTYLGL